MSEKSDLFCKNIKVKTLRNIFLVTFGLLLGILIPEVMLRIVGIQSWTMSLHDSNAHLLENPSYQVNSIGLRDREINPQKPANSYRIMIIGDSFMFGSGMPENEFTTPRVIERVLSKDFSKSGRELEVLNAGIPGSLTADWVEILKKAGTQFKPDLILVVFFLRDGTNTSSLGSFFGPIRKEIETINSKRPLYGISKLFTFFVDRSDRLDLSARYSKALIDSYTGTTEQQAEWSRAKTNLRIIQKSAEDLDAKMALAIYPVLVELGAKYPFKAINDAIEKYCNSLSVPVFDMLPAFLNQFEPELWVSAYDQHPNKKAHQIAAEALVPFIKNISDLR